MDIFGDKGRARKQRRKDRAAQEAENAQSLADTNQSMSSYLSNPSGQFMMRGTPAEQAEQAARLSQLGTLTGQTIFDTGAQNKDYLENLQKRRSGQDLAAQYMRDQANRNVASVGRSMAGRGVAGGVGAAAGIGARAQGDSAVGAQLQNRSDQLEGEFNKYVTRQQKMSGEALKAGSERGLANDMNINVGEGLFGGKIICTELHRQGLLPSEIQTADQAFGVYMKLEHPTIMRGYTILAQPIVVKMKSSYRFTKLVSLFAIPWAYHIAGKSNILGATVMAIGAPICGLVGWLTPNKCEA
jgi:hypothetical protein